MAVTPPPSSHEEVAKVHTGTISPSYIHVAAI
jgi:hypothetical protein